MTDIWRRAWEQAQPFAITALETYYLWRGPVMIALALLVVAGVRIFVEQSEA